MSGDRHSLVFSWAVACICAGGCHLVPQMPDLVNIPAAKDKNLELLHKPQGGYRYRAILLSDFGYLIEALTGRDRESYMTMGQVDNPTKETLENLNDLLGASPGEPDAVDLQIEWCARLLSRVENVPWEPSELVRERAALGLGGVGHWMGLTNLKRAPTEAAGPEDVAKALEDLLRSLRLAKEGGLDPGGVPDACIATAQLPLDINGAWRLLSVVAGLMEEAPGPEARGVLAQLRGHLRILLVEGGISAALSDPSDRVKVAGLRSMVRIMGPNGLTDILKVPLGDANEAVILGVVDLVSQVGLPSERTPSNIRGRCLSSLLLLAYDHPSPRVRVRAMIGLQRAVPSGPRSLREEDWFDWEMERRSTPVDSS